MDLPVGALSEGFADRVVLESRSDFARWGGCLLYLMMVPLAFLGAGAISVMLSVGIDTYITSQAQVQVLTESILFPLFAVMVGYLIQEYRSRDFQEVALHADRMEVIGKGSWLISDLLDAKAWPYGLSLVLPTGNRLLIQGLAQEKKLAAVERLLSTMVSARRQILDQGEEIHLKQSLKPVFRIAFRGLFGGFVMLLLCGHIHPMLAFPAGGAFAALVCWPIIAAVRGGGLVLSRTGIRGSSQVPDAEIPWREVQSCSGNSYFQDTLRVRTARGNFLWLSHYNPLVWALLIQELKGKGNL